MERKTILLPPTFLFIYLILALLLHFFFPIRPISGSPRILGTLFIAFGLILNLWADSRFKKGRTTVKPNETPIRLITDGPFRFSRHPMYLGFVVLLLGVSFILGSLSCLLVPIIMFITLEIKFISIEEKQMEKAFGKKYLEYKNHVRRWL